MPTKLQVLQELANKTIEEKKKIDRTVYFDDFTRAFKELVDYVKRVEEKLTTMNASDKTSALKEIDAKITAFKAEMEAKHSAHQMVVAKEMKKTLDALKTTTDEMRESIPEDYDDEEVREQVQSIITRIDELKIPEAFDATELTNKITELEKEVDELKKRPVGKGGQVTDKAVQYALMRSIQSVTPSGTIDGANTDFEVPSTIHAVLSFELNSRVVALGEYSIVGSARKVIRFDTAPSSAYSGKSFVITFI